MATFDQSEAHELGDRVETGNLDGADKFSKLLRKFAGRKLAQEFSGQISQLENLSTEAQEIRAQIDALVSPLLETTAGLDKGIQSIHATIQKEYGAGLSEIGTVISDRKSKLIEARAMFDAVSQREDLSPTQVDMLETSSEEYETEVSQFLVKTFSALEDIRNTLKIPFQGFELEQRAVRNASEKQAGLAELLVRFQEVLENNWKRMVQVVKNAAAIVVNSDKRVGEIHDGFISILKDVRAGRIASTDKSYAGFNLFQQ